MTTAHPWKCFTYLFTSTCSDQRRRIVLFFKFIIAPVAFLLFVSRSLLARFSIFFPFFVCVLADVYHIDYLVFLTLFLSDFSFMNLSSLSYHFLFRTVEIFDDLYSWSFSAFDFSALLFQFFDFSDFSFIVFNFIISSSILKLLKKFTFNFVRIYKK